MLAQKYIQFEEELMDGSMLSVVIWKLPEQSSERPHGYKYRLHCRTKEGATIVRYDNKTGKGDHKHMGDIEMSYEFESVEKLLEDFYLDIFKVKGWV